MRYSIPILFLSLLALHIGCSDPESPRVFEQDSTSLVVLSVGHDSVYWGETTWIELNETRTKIDSLRLYVGTSRTSLDSCIGNRLYFRVVTNAVTAKLRLYEGDAMALGNPVLTVMRAEFPTQVYLLDSLENEAYEWQTLFFVIYPTFLRKSDIELFFNGASIPYAHVYNKIHFHVPIGATSDRLKVRVMKDTFTLRQINVLKHSDRLFQNVGLSTAYFKVERLLGETITPRSDTTSNVSTDVYAYLPVTLTRAAIKSVGDSFFVDHTEETSDKKQRCVFAIHEDINGRLSGTMSLEYFSGPQGRAVDVEFRNLTWSRSGNYVSILAYGPLMSDQLVTIAYREYNSGKLVKDSKAAGINSTTFNSELQIDFGLVP
jgi:hypothetical protein